MEENMERITKDSEIADLEKKIGKDQILKITIENGLEVNKIISRELPEDIVTIPGKFIKKSDNQVLWNYLNNGPFAIYIDSEKMEKDKITKFRFQLKNSANKIIWQTESLSILELHLTAKNEMKKIIYSIIYYLNTELTSFAQKSIICPIVKTNQSLLNYTTSNTSKDIDYIRTTICDKSGNKEDIISYDRLDFYFLLYLRLQELGLCDTTDNGRKRKKNE